MIYFLILSILLFDLLFPQQLVSQSGLAELKQIGDEGKVKINGFDRKDFGSGIC